MNTSRRRTIHRRWPISTQWLERAQAIQPDYLLGFWPQNETQGTVAYDVSGNGYDGDYTSVTLGQQGHAPNELVCPYFDGVNDFTNLFDAGLAAAFNGGLFAVAGWFQVNSAANWTDGAYRMPFGLLDPNTDVEIYKSNVANQFNAYVELGGVGKTIAVTSYSPTGIIPYVLNAADSANGDLATLYLSGAVAGTPQTGFGVWDGLPFDGLWIGQYNNLFRWHGWLPPVALWSGVNLNAADIANWSNPI